MRLTKVHQEFWASHRGPRALRIKDGPSVDAVVNAHAEFDLGEFRTKNNASTLLCILRFVRKREGIEGVKVALRQMWLSPCTTISPKRRSSYCFKWLRRIDPNFPEEWLRKQLNERNKV